MFKKIRRVRPSVEPGFPSLQGQHYLQVLDSVEKITQPNWYLEIGSRSGTSLARRGCNFIGIDPEFALAGPTLNKSRQMHFMQMTSDDFFVEGFLDKQGIKPDFAFVDGMHWFEYALRDVMNCERVMDADGLIFMHDVLPFNHKMTERKYEPGTPWTGDVWKAVLALLDWRPDLEVSLIGAAKTGLACIRNLDQSNSVLFNNYNDIIKKYSQIDLKEVGPATYFDRFEIETPESFLARIAEAKA